MGKQFFYNILVFSSVALLAGCSTNPATGEKQFTALMSPQEEDNIGAEMHEKVVKQEELYKDAALQAYVNEVGGRIVRGSERPDVLYKFFVLDTPIVNAYAAPGGYIYLSRGILALMNNEAEMASVIAHEIGHITGRHMAERYSRGTLTAIGTAVLTIALGGEQGIANALGLGESLYMRSYSRGQENEADTLGMRYMSRAGYDSRGSAVFLKNLKTYNDFQQRVDGESEQADLPDLLSTHPATEERIAKTSALITAYPSGGDIKADEYLQKINGIIYGDSDNQGFLKGQVFYHPHIGFKFAFPQGYRVVNQTENVIGISKSGILVAFDMMNNKKGKTPIEFLKQDVMEGEPLDDIEEIDINGLKAATGNFVGEMDGEPVMLRLVTIAWTPSQIARFQILMPDGTRADEIEGLKRMTYSFSTMTRHEKDSIKPYRLSVVKGIAGDTQQSLGARMAIPDFKQEWFRILNGLALDERIVAGKLYKLITE